MAYNVDNEWQCIVETRDPDGAPHWVPFICLGMDSTVAAKRAVDLAQPINAGWKVTGVKVFPFSALDEWQCDPVYAYTLGKRTYKDGRNIGG